MEETVDILCGALEVATLFVTQKPSGKAEGVGNEGCSPLGPLLRTSAMPLCSADCQKLFPDDFLQLQLHVQAFHSGLMDFEVTRILASFFTDTSCHNFR